MTGRWIDNFPKLHYENGKRKNEVSNDQAGERWIEGRAPGPCARVGPPAGHEFAVPAEDRGWGDDEPWPTIPADQPREGDDHHPVAPTDARSWVCPLRDRELVSKDRISASRSRVSSSGVLRSTSQDEVADGEEHRAMIQTP